MMRCQHPGPQLVKLYFETGGEDCSFPVWACRACGAVMPDDGYLAQYLVAKVQPCTFSRG